MILQQAELIITANQRQALDVQRQYRLPAARVMAWPTFIEQLWRQIPQGSWHWLTGFEQRLVWQRLLKDDGRFVDSQQEALVRTCMEAWQWLTTWRVPLSALLTFATANSEWFHTVAIGYQQQCQRHAWLDQAAAISQLLADPARLKALLPDRVVFYRFWQMTPQLSHFQRVLQDLQIDVMVLDAQVEADVLPDATVQNTRWVADSMAGEMQAMVQWLAKATGQYPQDRFACIVPDLAGRRADLEACLQRYLPSALLSHIHFSLGKPLADYPLLHAMECLLKVAYLSELSLEDLSYLSRSPFWLHTALMERLVHQWRHAKWARFPQEAWSSMADPVLLDWWHVLKSFEKTKALPSIWCERFQAILHHSGWPALELSREERAVCHQLTKVYQDFSALDRFLGPLSVSEVLHYWRQYVQQMIFEPPSSVTPRIFFMGVFEALGSDFDQVWLMDAVSSRWPPLPSANALIPFLCQQHYDLPNASNRVKQEQALWQALSHCGRQWIVSHAAWYNAEAQAGLLQVESWPLLAWQAESIAPSDVDEVWPRVDDSDGVPCDDVYAPGGTAALKAQAHCPFQAYARYRLGLRALEVPESCLTAIERGVMVHAALFSSWQAIDSQSHLLALNEADLHAIIQRSARHALAELSPWRRRLLAKTLLSLERQRLEALLKSWLNLEAQRPPFRVEQLEKGRDVSFAGRLWRFRPDRIDVLDSGERVLIDYKTGLAPVAWQATPLLEPQLPFYAISSPLPVSALIIAQVTAKGQKMLGLAADTIDCGPLGQIKPAADWSEQCQRWYEQIRRLAMDYLAGKAEVSPAKGAQTCRSCDLASVCRINAFHV